MARAIVFLAGSQLDSGEFRTWAAPDPELQGASVFHSSPYATTYVAHCLGFAAGDKAQELRRTALGFLAAEMRGPGLWRFFSSRTSEVILPDLDDTACASVLLWNHPRILLGENLSLFLGNRDDRGLFYTWLGPGGLPNSVDSAVNANVVLYLGSRRETRPACEHLVAALGGGEQRSRLFWSLDDAALHYVVSRAFSRGVPELAGAVPRIVEAIRGRQRGDGSYGNELWTAVSLASLLNVGLADPDALVPAVSLLLDEQCEDGSWPGRAAFLGWGCYYGSAELTTAFCVEALARSAAQLTAKGSGIA